MAVMKARWTARMMAAQTAVMKVEQKALRKAEQLVQMVEWTVE